MYTFTIYFSATICPHLNNFMKQNALKKTPSDEVQHGRAAYNRIWKLATNSLDVEMFPESKDNNQ